VAGLDHNTCHLVAEDRIQVQDHSLAEAGLPILCSGHSRPWGLEADHNILSVDWDIGHMGLELVGMRRPDSSAQAQVMLSRLADSMGRHRGGLVEGRLVAHHLCREEDHWALCSFGRPS
jgi:hypothetical protein